MLNSHKKEKKKSKFTSIPCYHETKEELKENAKNLGIWGDSWNESIQNINKILKEKIMEKEK